MKPRVLLVVKDQVQWSTVPRGMEVVHAPTAREALDALAESRPFWVLVSDFALPDLSGIELLRTARSRWPDTIRLLVMPPDDQPALVAAINQARVHAVIIDPSIPEQFQSAVSEGAEEYRRAVVSRKVSVHEHVGIVQLVTGRFSPADKPWEVPPAALHLRERVRIAARLVRLPNDHDLEVAAMLSLVGLAAVPPPVLEKLLTHARLSEEENEFLDEIPAVGLRLIDGMPKTDGVAAILRHQGGDPNAMRAHEDGRREHLVPLASRILRAIVDLQVHENAGMKPSAAIAAMSRVNGRYDRNVIRALDNLFAEDSPAANPRNAPRLVEDLVPGSRLVAGALSFEGVPLVVTGTVLTPGVLLHLRRFADLGELVEPLYVDRQSETDAAS